MEVKSQVEKALRISDIVRILNAKIVCGEDLDKEIEFAFASDLMSDVLTLDTDKMLLITGLANLQALRTAEMSDISHILFVRNKIISTEMICLAEELGLTLLQSPASMFRTSGLLFNAGLKPLF